MMQFLDQPTRNLFFTGKGGVGKTSVACATAVRLADGGKKVLLVSTDPASNLDEVLGVTLENHPTAIPAIPTLYAMNLDPEKSAAEYRERMVGPYRGLLPEAAIKSMEEQFSGSCTLEIAAFDEFSRLLGDPSATAEFDHVIFDTAPTGHTLRLLNLPSAWDGFMQQNTSGTSCLGPLAGLQSQQKLYQESVKALGDPAVTTLVLVARAETSALREAARTSGELAELGVRNQHLVINGMFQAIDTCDPYAVALEQRGSAALAALPEGLKTLPHTVTPLCSDGIVGIDSLRQLVAVRGRLARIETKADGTSAHHEEPADGTPSHHFLELADLVDDLIVPSHGVILTMGKGGVGKTTVAAAVAVAIAERGYEVHLSTTDPAAHVAAALDNEHLPNLIVSRIDPAVETAKYSAEVLSKAGKNLDAQGKALLEEDLRSPCTEEIAVFRAFADAVAAGTNKFVVLDTAPTGHTVLLLDSALAYHREVTRQTSEMPEAVENLLPRLRDPNFTRVLIVTLPEATPVHEAVALQRDLRRAEIEPYAWVINQVLSPLPITDPLLKQRQLHEQKYLREVNEVHASRAVIIPWQTEPPTGLKRLSQLTQSGRVRGRPARSSKSPIPRNNSMAQNKNSTTSTAFYPSLKHYLDEAATRFDSIPSDRKTDLAKVADYVREKLSKSESAKLTFICTHNSRRSHLSQIWAQVAAEFYGLVGVETFSGGTEATAFNPRAVAAMQRCGLKIVADDLIATNPWYSVFTSDSSAPQICFSKAYGDAPNPIKGYCAVMTCSQADDACPLVMGCDLRMPIRYEDPKVADDTEFEAQRYDERSAQICTEMLYMMSLV